MASIDTSREYQPTATDLRAKDIPAEDAWLQLRDLISPRRQMRLPRADEN